MGQNKGRGQRPEPGQRAQRRRPDRGIGIVEELPGGSRVALVTREGSGAATGRVGRVGRMALDDAQSRPMQLRRRVWGIPGALAILVAATLPARASNDPLYGQQYGPQQVRAPQAWSRSIGVGVTIAIVDTGVDLHQPDLASKLAPGWDFVDGDAVPQDDDGHGTHVAGIAAAVTDNGVGIAGVAPGAKIIPVRVLNSVGVGSATDVDLGIRWAVDHGAKVVNLSLGSPVSATDALQGGSAQEDAIAYAWSKGALVVAAAGNLELAGSTQASGYNHDVQAVVVTATDKDGNHPAYANRADTRWALSAPGDLILSTWLTGQGRVSNDYKKDSGTSMAAPHVSGVAALLFAEGLDKQQVVDRLVGTAHSLGNPGTNGAGLVDAGAAVNLATTAGTVAGAGSGSARGSGVTSSTAPAARGSAPAAGTGTPPAAGTAPARSGSSGSSPTTAPTSTGRGQQASGPVSTLAAPRVGGTRGADSRAVAAAVAGTLALVAAAALAWRRWAPPRP